MSTHDLDVENDTFPNVRANVNAALQSLGSQQAGTADPPVMYPYERQARTDTGVVRRRNAANTGWVLDGTLAETVVIPRTSNTVLGLANHRCVIRAGANFTQTLTAAATLTDGWVCDYVVSAGFTVTLDANGSELIDGALTKVLVGPVSGRIVCNGTGFDTIGFSASAAGAVKGYVKITASPTVVTVTIASPGVMTWNAHGFSNDQPIVLSTTGALPTGLTAGTTYYVSNKATNTFELSASAGGPSINTTGSQSGTHTGTPQWVCPAGVTTAWISGSGGGGGSGGATQNACQEGIGGGGASGAAALRTQVTTTPGTAYTATVGAGGTAGSSGGGNGGTGGTTSLGALISLSGGSGGGGGTAGNQGGGGTAVSPLGGHGFASVSTTPTGIGGAGGKNLFGMNTVGGNNSNGVAGAANTGSGAGGANASTNTSNRSGAVGGSGVLIIEW